MGPKRGARAHLQRDGRGSTGGQGEVLRRFGLSADKRFGQHFLVSERVVSAILARVEGARGVLEIGPGVGALTAPLTSMVEKVVAIELDKRLIDPLSELAPNAELVSADVLTLDLTEILKRLPEPQCVVSNMPYNITGPLLGKVAGCRTLFRNAVLMMQKEVGDRVLAKPGAPDRGALSVAMQLQFEVKKVCDAKAGAFSPPPKVDSIVLDFWPRQTGRDTDRVLAVVRTGFKQPRKTLLNNLGEAYDKAEAKKTLEERYGGASVRPHQLTNEQWVSLAKEL